MCFFPFFGFFLFLLLAFGLARLMFWRSMRRAGWSWGPGNGPGGPAAFGPGGGCGGGRWMPPPASAPTAAPAASPAVDMPPAAAPSSSTEVIERGPGGEVRR